MYRPQLSLQCNIDLFTSASAITGIKQVTCHGHRHIREDGTAYWRKGVVDTVAWSKADLVRVRHWAIFAIHSSSS